MTRIAWQLWIGEMRVQRLISRRLPIAIAQVTFVVVVLTFLAARARHALAGGNVNVANVGVLSLVGAFLIFANVVVTGEESKARVSDIRQWAMPLPISDTRLRALLAVMGLLRGALFTLTLIGTTAVAALMARTGWVSRFEIVTAALILPLLPVSIGLWYGARRTGPVPNGFVTVPTAIAMMAVAVPFPQPGGFLHTALEIVAVPGLTLVGSADPSVAAGFLLAWAAATGWILARLDQAITADRPGHRPPLAGLLPAGPPGRRIGLDLAVHQLRWRDLVEAVLPAAALAGVAMLAGVSLDGSGSSAGPRTAVAALVLPVVMAGYRQINAITAVDGTTTTWLSTLPLPRGQLAWWRHLVSTAGSAAAATAFLLVLLAAGPGSIAPVVLLAVWLTPVVVAGWLALTRITRGLPRAVAYLFFVQVVGARLITIAVLGVVGGHTGVVAVAIAADLAVGVLGHLLVLGAVRRQR